MRTLGWIHGLALAMLIGGLTWILLEGGYSIYQGSSPHRSISSRAAGLLLRHLPPTRTGGKDDDGRQDTFTQDREDADWILGRVLTSRSSLESLFDELKASGVALGNSPYREMRNDEVAINYVGDDGCLRQKPNLLRYVGYLRVTRWHNFDPVSFFYADPDALTPRVKALLDRYALRQVRHTTNAFEERLTLPAVSRGAKVIVAGDSVAAGAMVDDSETIASHLQRMDPERQFINIGIIAADSSAIVCAAQRAAERYPRQISTFIYIWCENDFGGKSPYREPRAAMNWLAGYARTQGIPNILVVYSPFFYNTVPDVTRIEGYSDKHPTYLEQYHALRLEALAQGFAFLNAADVVGDVRRQTGTQFGPLSLYVDHVHYSDYGSELIARQIARHLRQ